MKTNYIFFIFIITFLSTMASCGEDKISVKSPNDKVSVTIDLTDNQLRMNISKNGDISLSDCLLGLTVDNTDIGKGAAINGKVLEKTINESYPVYGNHNKALNHCKEITIPLNNSKISYQILVRVYDDGVAIRYIIPGAKDKMINNDNTTFNIQDSTLCFWADYADSNEELHKVSKFSELPEGQAIVAPITVKTDNGYQAFSEAECLNFPDMSWIKQGKGIKANFTTNPQGWKNSGDTIISPWRCVILADNLTQLVNSDLIINLCKAPLDGTNFDWVKPGRVLWQWWSGGAPQFADQKKWYDAAARLTWEYYLVDDGWRDWKQAGKDQWQCLKEVIDYGNSVGVKSIVWVNSEEMRDREGIRSYLTKVKEVGAKGIKIDFIPPATPEIMQWYEIAREETYKLQLMCVFHGCAKPTGLQRTWPHEMTREGVRGNEYQITRYDRLMPQDQDVIVPFTRFLAGPADFTPVIFEKKELRGYTWAHELAQAVVYYSPLTHFADNYINYLDNPAEDLLRDIPVVWDETIVLTCSKIGKVVAFAKRKGSEWWVGVMNGKEPADISFPLDFITDKASAIILSDKDNVPDTFARQEKTIQKGDSVSIQLQPGGGYVMKLKNIK
ncbi:glycoside hydrolase family 97 protein [Dysgonomonas capnocytophagoides]|uniref:glycoside hydrolase family 97 protein n=1 Tax=Dysgonomonas capnocytophagoides TaxID=45254 RepID=UPI00047D732E|nr:glycoside hydrolase family 97 protein [Dysgonomonas capnocytophagoides]